MSRRSILHAPESSQTPYTAKIKKIYNFVNNILEHLIYPFDAASEGVEGVVWVRFIIDVDGYIKNITTKGPPNGALLEKEASRLISLLPKFMPGKHNDNYVNVEYFMPIDFQLD